MTAGLAGRLLSLRRLLCHPSLEGDKAEHGEAERKPPAMAPCDALSSLLRDVTAQVGLSRGGLASAKGAKRRKEESKLADLMARQAYLQAQLDKMRGPSSGEPGAAAMQEGSSCSVCLEAVEDPCLTPCGHVFCYECIATGVRCVANAKCPICREPLLECNLMRLQNEEPNLGDPNPNANPHWSPI